MTGENSGLEMLCLSGKTVILINPLVGSTLERHVEEMDAMGNVGGYNSLALDTNGFPHVSYYDNTSRGSGQRCGTQK
jgi:hypothetical protein